MSVVTPVTPQDLLTPTIPDNYTREFNSRIRANWDVERSRATVYFHETHPLGVAGAIDLTDVAPVFEAAGWRVFYYPHEDRDLCRWLFLAPQIRGVRS